jgi:NAD(P)-dependent dehydrogenase (short-subunit alcohol dehydrogenase family)
LNDSETEGIIEHFAGKVVLITDLDAEIGAEVAERVLRAGASILVTGIRATEIISNRFEGRQGITDTGIARSTTDKITELCAQIEQDHGGLDVIFANNHVDPGIDADSILDIHAAGMLVTLQKLQHLVRNGGTIVVCASFPPELREKSKFVILGTAVLLRSFAQSWSLVLETRRIRVNVVSLYRLDSDHDFTGEDFNVSSSRQPFKGRTRSNTVEEVASAIVGLASEDCSANGTEVVIVDGSAKEMPLSYSAESGLLGSPAQIVDNVVFLASDVSRPLTGMQLFPEGEIRKL